MASVFEGSGDDLLVSLFKQSFIRNPVNKIMLAEEPGTMNPNDNPNPNWGVIQDGRWMPDRDSLTARHHGKANVSFADGHAEAVTWQFGTNYVNSRNDL
jgi:prepilin-type processing-associated H-X9-DG protein